MGYSQVDNSVAIAIGTAIEEAARDLPEGYVVQIRVEKGGYAVDLYDDKDSELFSLHEDSMMNDIAYAVIMANEMSEGKS